MNSVPTEISQFADLYEKILHTGSQVIVSNSDDRSRRSDDDYIVLCKDTSQSDKLEEGLLGQRWLFGGSMKASDKTVLASQHTVLEDSTFSNENLFVSYKLYNEPVLDTVLDGAVEESPNGLKREYTLPLNVIITCNEEYFDDFTRATFLGKALNLIEKEDRVTLFEALTRNKWPDGNKERKANIKKRIKDYWKNLKLSPGSINTFNPVTMTSATTMPAMTWIDEAAPIEVDGFITQTAPAPIFNPWEFDEPVEAEAG